MRKSLERHLIFGTGPAACWTAKNLVEKGISVNAVNRSGTRPALMPNEVNIIKVDVSNASDLLHLTTFCAGVSTVYQMLNPPYSRWAELFPQLQRNTVGFSQKIGATYIALENLYMLDDRSTMTETSSVRSTTIKGQVRHQMHQELIAAYHSGSLKVATLRASDFYGPGVLKSAFGDRLFGPLVAGKAPSLVGDINQLHSVAYIADVGSAVAHLGLSTSESLMGRFWIAPHHAAQTQEHWLNSVNQALKIKNTSFVQQKPKIIRPWMLKMAGLFNKDAKAFVEMMGQFQAPYVVDSTVSEQRLQLQPTSLQTALSETLDWYIRRQPKQTAY